VSTCNFDLVFLDPGVDVAEPAVSHVAVNHSYAPEYKEANRLPVLTPGCYGPDELDAQIDRLKDELEAIRVLGHRKYAQRAK